MAEEYDAAQDRGEMAMIGRQKNLPDGKDIPIATFEQIGLSYKEIH